nr:immunoglobulin heavy chain junction region [Macaca mulatta]MOX91792.1 immunoglobulin heavy chain junction region [Macaca mulatta]MOX91902.1 immunoglobulin heavy chain junction region [Macaca mulatta]MOX92233.1 immunoglobulin heavy chain junction region [Macaca mulatta]MOX92242.1 immunoglobulin heavy chain junction region [Macaca mulatta]
CARRQSNLDSW